MISTGITKALDELYKVIREDEIDVLASLYDDEDLIVFALNYLRANLDEAFEPDEFECSESPDDYYTR